LFNWYRDNTVKLYNVIAHLGTKQMHGRLAATLIKLASSSFQEEQVYNFITRKDLAILSGMSVERMNNILNELKNDLIIIPKGKGFDIRDMDMMRRLDRYN
jgi:CRP/FNR family transcriptional regulator